MTKRFVVAISALLVCAGVLLLREVRSQPEQAMVEFREQSRGQVASPREREAERPPTERAPANRPENAIQQRVTSRATYEELVRVEGEQLAALKEGDDPMKYFPGTQISYELGEFADQIILDGEEQKPTREQAEQALEAVDSILSKYPEYERALAVGVAAACSLGDAAKARQYISRMKTAADVFRQKCRAVGVEL